MTTGRNDDTAGEAAAPDVSRETRARDDAAAIAAALGPLGDVSRETGQRLAAYADLLRHWQRRINLVAPATLADLWRRHMLDSAQLTRFLPAGAVTPTRPLVDLGAGAGFPGLVLAACGVAPVVLVESDQRKAAFLREAARVMGVEVTVLARRIETLPRLRAGVVTARALAALERLLAWATPIGDEATVYLFLKGRTADEELTLARKNWNMSVEQFPSLSDESGVILRIKEVYRGGADD